MTISHVADHAGVSRAAVYAVLNQNKKMNIGVSERTREKVLRAIAELGYIPNESARTLVSSRSRIVGLLLLNSESEFSLRLSDLVCRRFAGDGIMVIPAYSGNDAGQERELLRSFLARSVDCLIWARLDPEINADLVGLYHDYGVPVIHLAKDIAFDEDRVMTLAAEHAAACGAKRVGFLGYAGKMVFSGAERLARLRNAVAAASGLDFAGAAEVRDYSECLAFAKRIKAGDFSADIVVCFNDRLADLLIHCLNCVGCSVPDRVGVIGIDGYPNAFQPLELTTVRLPVEQMAAALWNIYNGMAYADSIVIEPELIPGKSTAY